MSNNKYSILDHKLEERDAIYLLKTIRHDVDDLQAYYDRAVIWARDIQGLKFVQISKALFNSPYKQTAHNYYNSLKAKGGVK